MSNICPNCDKPGCQVPDLSKQIAVAHRETPWLETEAEHLIVDAKLLCQANTVNWRARALTEAARADAAEARIADTSREARLIGLQANKAQAIARDPFWAGAQKAAQNLLARLEPKP